MYVHSREDKNAPTSAVDSSRPKRKRKRATLYCQRIILDIERSERLQKHHSKLAKPHSNLLSLPVEIRQHILYHVLNDEDLVRLPLKETARELSSICKTFKDDMSWVLRGWELREKQLTVVQKGAFDTYIAELMAPVMVASSSLAKTKNLRGASQKKEHLNTFNENKRIEEKTRRMTQGDDNRRYREKDSNSYRWSDRKWADLSQAERNDAQRWRLERKVRIAPIESDRKSESREFRREEKRTRTLQKP